MDEVADLLSAWELPQLVPSFRSNSITIQALAALSTEEIKELIPQVGPRALFMRCWKIWMFDFTNGQLPINILDTTAQNISLSDIELLPIIEVEPDEQGHPISTPLNNDGKEEPNKCSDSILIKLLKENLEAASLLASVGDGLTGDASRNLLSSLIAKDVLKRNREAPITSLVYNKWCAEIKRNFPKERITTYYIPPCITATGITYQARGKLVSQVINTRRRYQKLGVLTVKKKRNRENSPASSSTSTVSHLNIESDDSAADDVEEEIQWLKNSSDPWCMVEDKWRSTIKHRLQQLKHVSVEQYLSEFPALKKPHGIVLLHCDFDAANPHHTDNLKLNFPIIKTKLLEMLKYKKTKDAFYEELSTLADSPDEEATNVAAFMALPHLISTNVISLTPSNKKKRTEKEKKWKPTKVETRESFITHIQDDSYLRLTIEKRQTSSIKKGLTLQPYVVVVGPTLSNLKSYFVVLNTGVFYSTKNILSAVDSCFKAIWALNLQYSADCYGVWYFIQKGCYKLCSPHDRGCTSAESLLSDCM